MQIKKIHIKNFRSFNDSGLQSISKLFALIGKNNTGKSAFVDAIQMVWDGKKLSEEDAHKKNGKPIEIKLIIEEIVDVEKPTKQIELICQYHKSEVKYIIDGKERATFPKEFHKLLVIPAIRNPKAESNAGKDSFLKELVDDIVDLSSKEDERIGIENFKDKPAKQLSLDEIKALLEIKAGNQLNEISQSISGYLQSSVEDHDLSIKVEPIGNLPDAMSYISKILEPHLGNLDGVSILKCGTGLQSMIIMAMLQTYADRKKKENSILLIEEPEVYLHPELQRKMFAVLRKIAKRTQVIFTTHSPIMISDLREDSVRLIKREKGESVICEVDVEDTVKELGIRYEDVLNPELIIFVEGINDVTFFNKIMTLKHHAMSEGVVPRVKFIEAGGFDTLHAYALMHILLSVNVDAKFSLIVDGDGKQPEERKKYIIGQIEKKVKSHKFSVDAAKLKALPDRINPLTLYAIESYFLDFELLKKIDSSITKENATYFIAHYHKCYSKVLSGKGLERLKQTMKPKLLFEDPNTLTQLSALKNDYENDVRFLDIRSKLVAAWLVKKKAKICPINGMLDEITIKNPILKEPLDILTNMLKQNGLI